MLKFFRKIRQSLLEKVSIRKYLIYAIGEILLVVIGILIALQVNTWNEERKREKEENQYLNSLLNDFETAESSFQLILGAVLEQLDHNEQLLVLLAEPEGSTPTDSLVGMLRKSFIDVPFGIQVTAYNDLVNSGKLSILQSEELRRALSNFEIVNALANSYSEKAADQWAGQVTEFFVNRFNVSTIYGEDSDVIWEYPGIPHSSGYEKTPINKRFSSDKEAVWSRELANRIAIKNVLLEDAARSAKDVLILIDEIKLLISSSLRNNK